VFSLLTHSYDGLEINHYQEILSYIRKHRQQPDIPFDVVFMTNFSYWKKEKTFDEMISDYSSVGVSWFVHAIHPWTDDLDALRQVGKNSPVK
jgi:hypothetical protein